MLSKEECQGMQHCTLEQYVDSMWMLTMALLAQDSKGKSAKGRLRLQHNPGIVGTRLPSLFIPSLTYTAHSLFFANTFLTSEVIFSLVRLFLKNSLKRFFGLVFSEKGWALTICEGFSAHLDQCFIDFEPP